MKLQTALEVIKVNITAQIAGKSIQPVVFAGKPGLGKTRSIESLTTALNYGLVHYSVPELNSELLFITCTSNRLDCTYDGNGSKPLSRTAQRLCTILR